MTSLTYIFKEMTIGALSFLLLASLVGALYAPIHERSVPAVEAQWAVIETGPSLAKQAITAIKTTWSLVLQKYEYLKEMVLDPLAWKIANMVIQRMTKSIVTWINSGFKGRPSFMQDFGGFMTDIADSAVGNFISSKETLNFLCSPFQLDVRFLLSLQYAKTRNYGGQESTCKLSGVTANLGKFFEGKAVTNWNQWFKVTQDPQYNPYGAALIAEDQLSVRLGNLKFEQKSMLDWGKGFLSSQDCQMVDTRKICRTVTPGSTIEGALNDALGNPSKRIAVADEVNEIVVALFSQLVTQAFSGAGGLLGLTPASGSGASKNPYFEKLDEETADANSATSETIATAIMHETTYRNLIQSTVTWINSAATYKVDTYGNDTCHSGALTPELTNARLVAESKLAQSNASLTALNALSARYNAAIGLPNQLDIQSKVMEEFSALAGKIHGESEIEEEQEIFIPQVNTVRSDFIASIDSVCPTNRSGGNGL